jgi:hypothetical protein
MLTPYKIFTDERQIYYLSKLLALFTSLPKMFCNSQDKANVSSIHNEVEIENKWG